MVKHKGGVRAHAVVCGPRPSCAMWKPSREKQLLLARGTSGEMFLGRRSSAPVHHVRSLSFHKIRSGDVAVARKTLLAPRWSRTSRAGYSQMRGYDPL